MGGRHWRDEKGHSTRKLNSKPDLGLNPGDTIISLSFICQIRMVVPSCGEMFWLQVTGNPAQTTLHSREELLSSGMKSRGGAASRGRRRLNDSVMSLSTAILCIDFPSRLGPSWSHSDCQGPWRLQASLAASRGKARGSPAVNYKSVCSISLGPHESYSNC